MQEFASPDVHRVARRVHYLDAILEPSMPHRIRPLAFLDTSALLVLAVGALLLAAWTQVGGPLPGAALVNIESAVEVALAADTGDAD